MALNSYNVCRAFHCLELQSRQEDIQSNKSALLDLQMRSRFLVDRLTDMLSREQDVSVLDLYWSNKFVSSIDKVLKEGMADEPDSAQLDLRKLQIYSVQELQSNLDSIDPKIIVNMMELFENDRHRKVFVQRTLEGLKSEAIDIRKFQLAQLAKFIKHVSVFEPSEVKVFYNYVITAFKSGFFSINSGSFGPLTDIVVLFVKSGFLSPDNQNKFFLSYVLALKNTILPARGKEQNLPASDLIKVTWALVAMQSAGTLSIPLVPVLLEQIASFNRPEAPLSQEELLMLHQINVYVKDLIAREELPENFGRIVPEQVQTLASAVYEDWN